MLPPSRTNGRISTHITSSANAPVKEYLLGDSVVEIRGELEAPAVEHEVVKVLLPIVAINRDSAVVARPSVVDGAFLKLDLGSVPRQSRSA